MVVAGVMRRQARQGVAVAGVLWPQARQGVVVAGVLRRQEPSDLSDLSLRQEKPGWGEWRCREHRLKPHEKLSGVAPTRQSLASGR